MKTLLVYNAVNYFLYLKSYHLKVIGFFNIQSNQVNYLSHNLYYCNIKLRGQIIFCIFNTLNMKNNSYKKTGWGFIFLSIICVFIFLVDYKTKFIFNLTSISELGTILGGTSGLFASLAGLFFVLENLEMQRETISQQQISIDLQRVELKNQILEMKQTNESLKSQQLVTTFFSLLENHKKLIEATKLGDDNGHEGFNKLITHIKSQVTQYINSLINQKFKEYRITSYNPIYSTPKSKHSIDNYIKSVSTLINFVDVHLNSSTLYYEILDNYLSIEEKYLIGIYIYNHNLDLLPVFNSKKYNFLSFYELQVPHYKLSLDQYYPKIHIARLSNQKEDYGNAKDKDFENFMTLSFKKKEDHFKMNFNLEGITIESKLSSSDFEDFSKYYRLEDLKHSIKDDMYIIDLYTQFSELAMPFIGFGTMYFIFNTTYNGKKIDVQYYINYENEIYEYAVSIDENEEDFKLVNGTKYVITKEG